MNRKMQILMKEARKNKGLTQAEIAKQMDVKGSTVSNWENGIAEPDIDSFILFCRLCDTSFKELLTEAYGDTTEPTQTMKVTAEEAELIQRYRKIDERGKRTIRRLLNSEYEDAMTAQSEKIKNS